MKKKIKPKRKVEFSKVLVVSVCLITTMVAAFTCYMVWITMDTTPLAYLIPAVFTEAATGTGFYYNKAKKENEIKLMAICEAEAKAKAQETSHQGGTNQCPL